MKTRRCQGDRAGSLNQTLGSRERRDFAVRGDYGDVATLVVWTRREPLV